MPWAAGSVLMFSGRYQERIGMPSERSFLSCGCQMTGSVAGTMTASGWVSTAVLNPSAIVCGVLPIDIDCSLTPMAFAAGSRLLSMAAHSGTPHFMNATVALVGFSFRGTVIPNFVGGLRISTIAACASSTPLLEASDEPDSEELAV